MVCQGNTIYRVALIYRCVLRVLNFVADAGNDFGFQRVSYLLNYRGSVGMRSLFTLVGEQLAWINKKFDVCFRHSRLNFYHVRRWGSIQLGI